MTCPGDIELARAVAVGADPALAAHLDACAGCRAAWDGARAAIDAARELPVALPPAARREEMRTAILAAAAAGPVRGPARAAWLGRALAGAAAAGIAGYLALSHASAPAAPPHGHGTIRPHAGARYLVRSIGPDEVVWLGDGAIDVEVEPLHPGERFRVVVGGAELEVRGTAFTATARADHLVEVSVAHGRVDLMPDAGGRASTTLAAGQSWYAAVAAGRELRSPAELSPTADLPTPSAERRAPSAELSTPSAELPSAERRVPSAELPTPSAERRVPSAELPPPRAERRVPRAELPTPSAERRVPRAELPLGAPRPAASHAGSPTFTGAASSAAGPRAPAAAAPAHRVASANPEPEPEPPPVAAAPLVAPAAAAARAPAEAAYDAAWAALRAAEFARASSGFARVVLLAPDSPLVEDASFWRAVALARGRRGLEAVAAFHDYLDGYPRSPRAGEASAMLGWLLIDARAFDEAARRFTAAAGDPDPRIRGSARAGLDALSRRAP